MTATRSVATSFTLRFGVLLSCALLIAGLSLYLAHPHAVRSIRVGDLRQIVRSGEYLSDATLVHAGLLVLMLTPLSRVIVLTIEFLRRREPAFALIATGVLLLIGITVALGV